MPRVTLDVVSNIGGSPASAALTINKNFAAIQAAFERCLFLDGTEPNQMEADLDLNGHILNNVELGAEVVVETLDN